MHSINAHIIRDQKFALNILFGFPDKSRAEAFYKPSRLLNILLLRAWHKLPPEALWLAHVAPP